MKTKNFLTKFGAVLELIGQIGSASDWTQEEKDEYNRQVESSADASYYSGTMDYATAEYWKKAFRK